MRAPRRKLSLALALTACLAVAAPAAADPGVQPLFRIERSKNANVVQYDARVQEDGSLDPAEPIDVYWLRLAGSGKRKELKWLQRRVAYGFSVHWAVDGSALELEMVVPIGRRVEVVRSGDAWQARTPIDGRPCHIERIYVKSTERRFLPPKVEYIDFAGSDVETGERRTERYTPD